MTKAVKQIRIEGNTAIVPLTRGLEALIDIKDIPLVASYNWYAAPSGHTFYAGRNMRVGDKVHTIKMHRVILGEPQDLLVDHINQNGLDNRRENLRLATPNQNQHNRKKQKNSSGYKGVTWRGDARKWQARIMVDSRQLSLGMYLTAEEAYAAYVGASELLHGDFSRAA